MGSRTSWSDPPGGRGEPHFGRRATAELCRGRFDWLVDVGPTGDPVPVFPAGPARERYAPRQTRGAVSHRELRVRVRTSRAVSSAGVVPYWRGCPGTIAARHRADVRTGPGVALRRRPAMGFSWRTGPGVALRRRPAMGFSWRRRGRCHCDTAVAPPQRRVHHHGRVAAGTALIGV